MRIRFLRDYQTKEATPQRFRKDQEVDVSEASANHFISRGAAEQVPDKVREPKPKTEPEPKAEAKSEPEAKAESKPAPGSSRIEGGKPAGK